MDTLSERKQQIATQRKAAADEAAAHAVAVKTKLDAIPMVAKSKDAQARCAEVREQLLAGKMRFIGIACDSCKAELARGGLNTMRAPHVFTTFCAGCGCKDELEC